MADNLPVNFAIPEEGSVVSYSFQEVFSKRGYITYYLCASKNSTTTSTFLTTSGGISSGVTVIKKSGDTASLEYNYDYMFNLPARVRGKVYFSFALGNGDFTASNSSCYLTAKLFKVVAAAETQLGTTQTSPTISTSADKVDTLNCMLEFDLSDAIYSFGSGESLRLEVVLYHTGATGEGIDATSGYGADPVGNSDEATASDGLIIQSGYSTTSTLNVPFILEI
jgi:hypothetical protein